MFKRKKSSNIFERPVLEILEPRLLLSADPVSFVAGALLDEVDTTQDRYFEQHASNDFLFVETHLSLGMDQHNTESLRSADTDQERRTEIVILDSSVEGGDKLVADVLRGNDSITTHVYLIDAARDGVVEISSILAAYQNLDAVHILSHGTAGEVFLGNGVINADTLVDHREAFVNWGNSLATDADLLFYGCDLASTPDGQALIDELAELIGADVAASTDRTGHILEDGDWELEYQVGELESALPLSMSAQQDWQGVLERIDVTTFDDLSDGGDTTDIASLRATPGTDGISLREAIIATNNEAGQLDEIVLEAGTYTLAISGGGEELSATGDLDIRDDLTITGAGANQTFIQGDGTHRIFHVDDSVAITVSISNVGIQNGFVNNFGNNFGAGLRVDGTAENTVVTVNNVWFSGNHTQGSFNSGGAIYNSGDLTVENSLIENNSARAGGGVVNLFGGTLTMSNVTLSSNSATGGDGGGFFNGSTATLQNITVADNSATGKGGGLHTFTGANTTLSNTLVANNTASSNPDLDGAFVSNFGNNLIEAPGSATGLHAGDIVGIDPNLGLLADNGGQTQTHALMAGSDAIDNGTVGGSPTTDQRGEARDASPDIGAFEYLYRSLWLSTVDDTTAGGISWDFNDTVVFGDPGLNVEPGITAGTFTQSGLDLDNFAAGLSAENMNGIHYVTQMLDIGSANAVTLLPGDVLFSMDRDDTLGGLLITAKDIALFRPTTRGDYSSGTFSIILDNPLNQTTRGFAFVETTTVVGGVTLDPGDFLLTASSGSFHFDITRFQPSDIGPGSTSGSDTEFIDGNSADIGFGQQIYGIGLVQTDTTLGNTELTSGQLLIALKGADTVGANSLTVTPYDIFALSVSATGKGTSVGVATMLFEGSDTGLDSAGEELIGIALYQPPGPIDTDGDGLWDHEEDLNSDLDTNPSTNPGPDTDVDTVPNYLDADDDGDALPTSLENADPNADGDPRDAIDSDRDGQPDYLDAPTGDSNGTVDDEQKISHVVGNLTATLDPGDSFGQSVAGIGDLNGDGVNDMIVGAYLDDDGGTDRGAAYILFLNANGTINVEQKISSTSGGLTAILNDDDHFGSGVAGVGDIDGDGIIDIAVGAAGDDDVGSDRGAIHLLFLNSNGTVKAEQKISASAGGLTAVLNDSDGFGESVSSLGDINEDGIVDIAVGASRDDDGGTDRGAVHILFLNADGTVGDEQKISELSGSLTATLDDDDRFGVSVAGIADIDGDGTADLAVGALGDDDGGTDRGAAYVLFLNTDGTVKAEQKISATQGLLAATIDDNDHFGISVAGIGDVDGDGIGDIAVGTTLDDDGGTDIGAVHILFLNSDGSVKAEQKISNASGGLVATPGDGDMFGGAIAGLGDLDGDGLIDIAVGAAGDDDGSLESGAVHVLNLGINDAPVLADDLPVLTAINQDDATSAGDSVANIVIDGSITDADDDAVESLAIIAVDNTNGSWQFSTDNGLSWANVDDGSLAVDHALLLDGTLGGAATQLVRFVPAAGYTGSATITFRAWDQSAGVAGSYADTTSSGGATPFSSITDTASILVRPVNSEPTLTTTAANPTFTEGGGVAGVFNGTTVDTIESGQTLIGLTLTVAGVSDGTDEILNVDGSAIALTNGTTGTSATNSLVYNVSVTGGTATVTLSSGTMSVAATQTLVDGISYQNNSAEPTTSDRVVTLTELVDSGGTDNGGDDTVTLSIASTVTVLSVNDEPTLTTTGDNPTFTEGGVVASVFSGTTVDTIESGQTLTGLSLTVAAVSDGADEILNVDGSAVALTNGTTGTSATNSLLYNVSVSGGTATVTLSGGTMSVAAAQTLVDGISYQNSSSEPSTSDRVVTLTQLVDSGGTDDGGDNTTTLSSASTVTVLSVNDEPTLTTTADNPTFTEGGVVAGVFSGTTVDTIESGQTLIGLTLTVSGVSDGADEVLNLDGSAIALTNGTTGTSATNSLLYNVSVTSGTATVTLSGGTVSIAAAQTLVDGISYQHNSAEPSTSDRVVTLTQLVDSGGTDDGGDNTTTLSIASTVTVLGVNDEPTLTTTAANPTFSEGGVVAGVFSGTTVDTIESGQTLIGLTLTVAGVSDGGDEILNLDGSAVALTNGITGTSATNSLLYNVSVTSGTATVTLSGGTVSIAAAQTLVDGISYQNNSAEPSTSDRVVTLTQLVDSGGTDDGGDNTTTLSIASTVTVLGVNDEPTLTTTAANPTFSEGGVVAGVFSGTTVDTIESGQTLIGLTLTVSGVSDGSDEILNVDGSVITLTSGTTDTSATNNLLYNVSVSGGTATVTLSGGTVSVAATQTLVDGISYQNNSAEPTTSDRVVTLTELVDSGGTDDGGDNTTTLSSASTVTVVSVNDEPTLTTTADNPIFTEGGVVAGVFSGTTVGTIESGQTLIGLSLTVAGVSDGGDEILNVDGSTVALTNGTTGTSATNSLLYNVSVSGGTATVTLSGSTMSVAAAQTLVDGISYQNNSAEPSTSDRVVTLTQLVDSGGTDDGGDNTITLSSASTVTVLSVNDEPTLTTTADNPTFTEGGVVAGVFSGTTVDTIESGQTLIGLTLTVAGVSDGGDEILNVDGSAVALTNGTTGTSATNSLLYNVSVTSGTATVILSGGTLSVAAMQTLVDGISYQNNSAEPTTSDRVVSLTQLVDSGGTSDGGDDTTTLSVASTVTVLSVNDEPTLTTTADNPTFTEGGVVAGVFSGTTVDTIESGQTLIGLTLTVAGVSDGGDEILNVDGSAVVLTNGITGTSATNGLLYNVSVTSGTATVTLSGGTVSIAGMQILVDGISYQNNSAEPSTNDRVVTLTQLVDSGGTDNGGDNTTTLSLASTVTVLSVNDEPTLTTTAANPTFTEGGVVAGVFSGTTVDTLESGQTLIGLSLTVAGVSDGGDEFLNLDGSAVALTNGTTGTSATNSLLYNVSVTSGTATVTLSGGTVSAAAMQTLVDGISYQNSSMEPTTSDRVVTLTELVDSGGTDNGGDDTVTLSIASTVTVLSVNDEPTLTTMADNPTFTEGSVVASVFSGTTVDTIESGQTLIGLSLTVDGVSDGADEVLNLDGSAVALTNGTTGTSATNSLLYNVSVTSGTATVILSGGTLNVAAAQTLVDGISYQNNSTEPTTSDRVVTLTELVDSGGTDNGGDNTTTLSLASTVTVATVNEEPTLTTTAANPTFAEGGVVAGVFSGTTVDTIENGQTLIGLSLTVAGVSDGADEVLNLDGSAIALTNGTTGTSATNSLVYNVSVTSGTATVTLSGGTLSVAAAQTLVDGISYQNNSTEPTTSDRVVTLTELVDSGGTDNGGDDTVTLSIASTVTVLSVNDEPTLTTTGDNPTFTEGGVVAGVFSGTAVDTIESGQTLIGLTLTVAGVSDGTDEVLNLDGSAITLTHGSTGTSATNSLLYNVTVTSGTATITLSGGTLSAAGMQILVDGISYQNNSADPSTNDRVVTLTQLVDSGGTDDGGDNTTALSIASTVTVLSVNDEPTLTTTADNPIFTEGGFVAGVFSGTTVDTIESGQTLIGLTLTVAGVSDGTDEVLNLDGSAITLTHGSTGTSATNSLLYNVTVTSGVATLSLTGGTLNELATQTLIDTISYQNNSEEPSTGDRVVTLTQLVDSGGTDDGGDNTTTLSSASTVTVLSVNDEPTLTTTADNPTFTEGGVVAGLFSGTTVDTIESGQTLIGFTLTVAGVSDGADEILNVDGSAITLTSGTTGTSATNSLLYNVSVTSGTATVTLSGSTLSVAATQTLVDGISYQNISAEPSTNDRVVTLTQLVDSGGTDDGGDDTLTLSIASTVTVLSVNDEPTLTTIADNPIFTEGSVVAGVFSGTTVDTIESGQTLIGLNLTVDGLSDGTDELVNVDGSAIVLTNGVTGTSATNSLHYNVSVSSGTATVALSGGTLSIAAAQTLVDNISYQNNSVDPTTSNRVVTLTQLIDSGGTDNGGVDTTTLNIESTVSLQSANSEPALAANTGITVLEGSVDSIIDSSMLMATDADNAANELIYTLTSNVDNGTLNLNGRPLGLNDTFSQRDIDDNLITYDHDDSESLIDQFEFVINDGLDQTDSGSFGITIVAINDNDPQADNEQFTVIEGGVATELDLESGTSLLQGDVDLDLPNDVLAVSVTAANEPSHGSVTLNVDGTFEYIHDGSESTSDSFTYELSDADGGASDIGVVTVTILPANDAPVLDNNRITIVDGSITTLSTSELSAIDMDSQDSELLFLVSEVTGGQFELLTGPGVALTSFSQAQVSAGFVVFVGSSEGVAPTYKVAVTDGSSSQDSMAAAVTFVPTTTPELAPAIPETVPAGSVAPVVVVPSVTDPIPETNEPEDEAIPDESGFQEIDLVSMDKLNAEAQVAFRVGEIGNEGSREVEPVAEERRSSSKERIVKEQSINLIELESLSVSLVSSFEFLEFDSSLNQMRDDITQASRFHKSAVGSVVAVGSGLSVGYVIWLIRGGVLLTSVLSSLPAWQFVDPLPVLAHRDDDEQAEDDSLESIIHSQSKKADSGAVNSSSDGVSASSIDPPEKTS